MRIHNVRVNNLHIDDLTLKQGIFHVFCGPSGSGKSSLAFDVIYTEADKLGRAIGVSRIYRKTDQGAIVENLPQCVIGIEQQLTHHSMVESVAWHINFMEMLRCANSKNSCELCSICKGKGYVRDIAPERVVSNATKPVTKGAFSPAVKKCAGINTELWRAYCKREGIAENTAWGMLPKKVQEELLYKGHAPIKAIVPALRTQFTSKLDKVLDEEMDYYITRPLCQMCDGWGFMGMKNTKVPTLAQTPALSQYAKEWLIRLGIGHIPLLAPLFKLSASQVRKLRFFAVLSRLQPHSLIIFDEPAAGLMPKEAAAMAGILRALQQQGHTVIAVEHASQVIAEADSVLAFGPGSGAKGGRVVFQGSPHEYLRRAQPAQAPMGALPSKNHKQVLKASFSSWYGFANFRIQIPLQCVVCVCGPSGSGKSAYVEAAYAACDKTSVAWQGRKCIIERTGHDHVRRPHKLTPEPIGLHSGTTPATYVGLWNKIRNEFAALPESKKHHLGIAHFSFNTKKGQCPHCKGRGYCSLDAIRSETCPHCQGTRYRTLVLSVQYKGRTIAQINECTVAEALSYFHTIPNIMRQLEHFKNMALDYIVLGQPSNTLSGGETLRVKLVKLLSGKLGQRTMYIMDNPCRGIGNEATALLAHQLHRLSEQHSVLMAENEATLVKQAHWLIMLGTPRIGANGARHLNVLYEGTPVRCPENLWGGDVL